MNHLWIGAAGGVLAFAHCLGMCGGFALHLSRGGGHASAFARQILWHAGKTATYTFLGAAAGLGGGALQTLSGMAWTQKALAYGAGAIMVLAGLSLLGLGPSFFRGGRASESGQWFGPFFRSLVEQPSAGAALARGLAAGFLPCPIVLAFLAYAAHAGSAPAGIAVMAGAGLGTMAPLLALGMTGRLVGLRFRRWGAAAAGAALVLLGIATALRGTETLHRVLGCPPAAAGEACCPGTGSEH